MRRAVVEEILANLEQVTRDGTRVIVPEGLRVELLCALKDDVLVLGPVKDARFGEAYLTVVTENETYFVDYDHVFAVRTKGKAQGRPVGRTGFSPS